MAQRNQISTLPVTVSLLVALTWASTSASVMAKAGVISAMARRSTSTRIVEILILRFVINPPQIESGLAMKAPTMEINRRRHQAFISNKKSWPPNIRHQLLKMLEVDWDAPMAKATGAV